MKLPSRVTIFALLTIAIFVQGCFDAPPQKIGESRIMMDTLVTINTYAASKDAEEVRAFIDHGFSQFAAVEQMASFHLPESELSMLNDSGAHDPSSGFLRLVEESLRLHEETMGYFDASFAVLQSAYGFYDGNHRVPGEDEIKKLMSLTGLSKVIEVADNRLKLASGSLIDMGGIAGGYAVDIVAEELRKKGLKSFLIDDAGDIWLEGLKPGAKPWRVAVRDPRNNGVLAIITSAVPVAISTSGDYERFIEIGEKKYGHIMNAKTGRPVDYYSSVTIIASTTIKADAYSTAAFAMPPAVAFEWVENMKLPALFLTNEGEIYLSSSGKNWFSQVVQHEK